MHSIERLITKLQASWCAVHSLFTTSLRTQAQYTVCSGFHSHNYFTRATSLRDPVGPHK